MLERMSIPQRLIRNFSLFVIALFSASLFWVAPAFASPCPSTPASVSSNATYSLCDFTGWDFTGRSLSNVDFAISYLGGSHFGPNGGTAASLDHVSFGNAISTNVDFNHAHITNSTFYLANMNDSDLADTVLTGTTFHDAYFDGASFILADFTGATLDNMWLRGSNLSYATITQAQLDHANLSATTICPDTYPLGDHVGNCFSALKAPIPVTTPPVVTSSGFTFDITNNTDYYTFTAVVTAGPGVASLGTPSGTTLPVAVTGAPPGSNTVVTITGSIGSGASEVVSTTTYNYQAELARTGVSAASIGNYGSLGLMAILLGAMAMYLSRRKKI